METKPITYEMAAALLGLFHDRRIHPLTPASHEALDFARDEECDALCVALADDPLMELNAIDVALLRLLKARILFAGAAAMTRPNDIIGRVPADAPAETILSALLGVQIRNTRLPPEWRDRPGFGARRQ